MHVNDQFSHTLGQESQSYIKSCKIFSIRVGFPDNIYARIYRLYRWDIQEKTTRRGALYITERNIRKRYNP